MLKVVQMLAEESPGTRLVLQIHDELLFEVPDQEIETTAGNLVFFINEVCSFSANQFCHCVLQGMIAGLEVRLLAIDFACWSWN